MVSKAKNVRGSKQATTLSLEEFNSVGSSDHRKLLLLSLLNEGGKWELHDLGHRTKYMPSRLVDIEYVHVFLSSPVIVDTQIAST